MSARRARRKVEIHVSTADENVGFVSDPPNIESFRGRRRSNHALARRNNQSAEQINGGRNKQTVDITLLPARVTL